MKQLNFLLLCAFCLLVSLGNLQAQSKSCSATCTKTAKVDKTNKAESNSLSQILIMKDAGVKTANCNPANCKPGACNPANCKPGACNPANCKKGAVGVKASMTQTAEAKPACQAKAACKAKAAKVALAESEL